MPAAYKRCPVRELQPGQFVEDEVYRIVQKDLRTTNNGGLYIHAVLADASGEILARIWNASQGVYDAMPEGGFLYVRGRVENYKGARQFIIDGMRAVAKGEVDPAEFLPRTPYNVDEMWSRTLDILRCIREPSIRALTAKFVLDEKFVADFKRAPAARANHHAYVGGLLEHTLGLLELAVLVVPRYRQVNADLVLLGIFLHDVGKVRELNFETNFEYTTEGQLVGHIAQGVLWVHDKVRELEAETGKPFPRETLALIDHIILSHHGKYEFGSPKLPAIPEAVIVHHLDNLDAKVHMMLAEITDDPDQAAEWTQYNRALETRVYRGLLMERRPASAAASGTGGSSGAAPLTPAEGSAEQCPG